MKNLTLFPSALVACLRIFITLSKETSQSQSHQCTNHNISILNKKLLYFVHIFRGKAVSTEGILKPNTNVKLTDWFIDNLFFILGFKFYDASDVESKK